MKIRVKIRVKMRVKMRVRGCESTLACGRVRELRKLGPDILED